MTRAISLLGSVLCPVSSGTRTRKRDRESAQKTILPTKTHTTLSSTKTDAPSLPLR